MGHDFDGETIVQPAKPFTNSELHLNFGVVSFPNNSQQHFPEFKVQSTKNRVF
jgi:hypothetical protein